MSGLRNLVVALVAAGSVVGPATVASAAGPDVPRVVIETPREGERVGGPTLHATGFATDDDGVESVVVLVRSQSGDGFVRTDGTTGAWTPEARWFATPASPGATTTTWSVDIPLEPGCYLALARAYDLGGRVSEKNYADNAHRFCLFPGGPAAPEVTITQPTSGVVVPMGPVALGGTVTDDVGARVVKVAIQDQQSQKWLRRDGSWGAGYAWIGVWSSVPQPSWAWSYKFVPPAPGRYGVLVGAEDFNGNVDATKPWLTFTVG